MEGRRRRRKRVEGHIGEARVVEGWREPGGRMEWRDGKQEKTVFKTDQNEQHSLRVSSILL
jgi:hypothetical protein